MTELKKMFSWENQLEACSLWLAAHDLQLLFMTQQFP